MQPEHRRRRDRLDRLPMTRREALRAGLAGVALSGLSDSRATAGDQPEPGWIDAHSHLWTRDIERFPLAEGKSLADLVPPSFTAEELIRTAEPEGVRQVVLIQHHIYHGWDNSYLIDAAAKYPDRFRVVGMIDDTRPAPDEQMRKLLKDRVTGFRITSWIRGREKWLDGDGMASMWRCGAETRQAMCCLIDPPDLPAVDRMCERNPETPVVIDHFARVGADGMIRDDDVQRLCGLVRHKNVRAKLSGYYALGEKKPPYLDLVPMIRRLYETFGPQRLMWASDSPYQLLGENTYKASISLVRDRLDFIAPGDLQWLLRKTAESVYFFDA
jgi:predicted TIM-barrel fold metal-dependent hydrolase